MRVLGRDEVGLYARLLHLGPEAREAGGRVNHFGVVGEEEGEEGVERSGRGEGTGEGLGSTEGERSEWAEEHALAPSSRRAK